MKKKINFGSILQFRNIVKDIRHSSKYIGKDKEGNNIFDNNIKEPILDAIASEKIHGTNAGVSFNNLDGFWVQSSNNILTTEKDNYACAFYANQNEKKWLEIINKLVEEYKINLDTHTITVFYEWCGKGIQDKSAVTDLSKRSIVFQHFKVSPIKFKDIEETEEMIEEESVWYETSITKINKEVEDKIWVSNNDSDIYNIMNFKHYKLKIDFSRPDLTQNFLIDLVKDIENCSPVGKSFGKENIGEGVVVTLKFKGNVLRFKVKGEKHSKSKVKKIKKVDSELEQKKIDFANYATPAWRLEQAWQKLFGLNNEKIEPDIKFTGDFIRLVIKDIMKEELDILSEKNLEPKQVNSFISKISSKWFREELDKIIFDK